MDVCLICTTVIISTFIIAALWESVHKAAAQQGLHPFDHLWGEQAKFSQKTFGPDQERGPIGAIRHLQEEAKELEAKPDDVVEYADCLLLILDAARRNGMTPDDLLYQAFTKLQVNRRRKWPKPAAADQPIKHISEGAKA